MFVHQQTGVLAAEESVGRDSTDQLCSFRFLVLPVVCSLLLPSKPVATDDDEQRGFARSRRCPGSNHLLFLLYHRLGEFSFRAEVGRGEMKPALGSALSGEEESGEQFGEVSPGGQQGAVLRKRAVPPNSSETVVSHPGSISSVPSLWGIPDFPFSCGWKVAFPSKMCCQP